MLKILDVEIAVLGKGLFRPSVLYEFNGASRLVKLENAMNSPNMTFGRDEEQQAMRRGAEALVPEIAVSTGVGEEIVFEAVSDWFDQRY